MAPPLYLKRIKGTYYVQVPVPSDKQESLGRKTLERSLRTKDEGVAHRLRHTVIAEFMAEIEKAGRVATGADALVDLAERTVKSGNRGALVGFDITVDDFIEKHPKMPPQDVAKVRRANAIAHGSAGDLLDRQAEAWLKFEASKGLAPATLKDKEVQIGHLLAFLGADAGVSSLSRAAAVDYVENVLNVMDVSKSRKAVLLQGAGQFADWLELRGKLASNPFIKASKLLRANDKRRAPRRSFTSEEVYRLLSVMSDQPGPMLHLAVLMAFSGARPQELCDVRANAVDDRMMRIDDSKTANGIRLVPIHPTIAPLVAKLAAESSDGFLLSGLKSKDGDRYRPLGKNLQRLVRQLFKDESLVPYSLRRTVVTQLEAAGTPAWVQDAIIGHEVNDATERRKRSTRETNYLDDPGFERKAAALAVVNYGEEVDVLMTALCSLENN
jgi:integrase